MHKRTQVIQRRFRQLQERLERENRRMFEVEDMMMREYEKNLDDFRHKTEVLLIHRKEVRFGCTANYV